MRNRKRRSAVRWAAMIGGMVLGMALNTIAAVLVLEHIPQLSSLVALFTLAIIVGGCVCGVLGLRWAQRFLESHK